jgi:hypothetical protein
VNATALEVGSSPFPSMIEELDVLLLEWLDLTLDELIEPTNEGTSLEPSDLDGGLKTQPTGD